jgi:imidazoleglycerol-phosphate dehydratase
MLKRKVKRKAKVERKTKETQINCSLNIDGKGRAEISTGIGFLEHMLELFVFHGLFDLKLKARGDLKVDLHHTNEDVGIVLGQAFKEALGNKEGIRRFGFASVPMGAALARAVVDISGRGELYFSLLLPEVPKIKELGINFAASSKAKGYNLSDLRSFLEAFVKQSGITLNIGLLQKEDIHHQSEAVFKALGLALDRATSIDARRAGVPSTKGIID